LFLGLGRRGLNSGSLNSGARSLFHREDFNWLYTVRLLCAIFLTGAVTIIGLCVGLILRPIRTADVLVLITLIILLLVLLIFSGLCGQDPVIMFGVLIVIFRHDTISGDCRLSRQRLIFIDDLLRVAPYLDSRTIAVKIMRPGRPATASWIAIAPAPHTAGIWS
jgi:hypothetical protein